MNKFDVERFKNSSVRDRLTEALEYKRAIDDYVNKQSGGIASTHASEKCKISPIILQMIRISLKEMKFCEF